MKKMVDVTAECEHLGSRLKKARLEKNLTQTELAQLVGVSRGKIVAAEKGYTTTQTFVAIMIALQKSEELDQILPEESRITTEVIKRKKKQRQRASGNSSYSANEGNHLS